MSLYEVDFPFTIRTVSPAGKPGPLTHKILRVELDAASIGDLHAMICNSVGFGPTRTTIVADDREGK